MRERTVGLWSFASFGSYYTTVCAPRMAAQSAISTAIQAVLDSFCAQARMASTPLRSLCSQFGIHDGDFETFLGYFAAISTASAPVAPSRIAATVCALLNRFADQGSFWNARSVDNIGKAVINKYVHGNMLTPAAIAVLMPAAVSPQPERAPRARSPLRSMKRSPRGSRSPTSTASGSSSPSVAARRAGSARLRPG